MTLPQNWSVKGLKNTLSEKPLKEVALVETVKEPSPFSRLKAHRVGTDTNTFNTQAKLWLNQKQICEH